MKRRELIKMSLISLGSVAVTNKAGAQINNLCKNLQTPRQVEGPFYPLVNQIDEDSDLVVVSGNPQIAKGEIVIVEGNVTDQHCDPVQGALVEIWQACQTGRYNHRSDPNPAPLDPNFQYWGQAMTDENGFYRFRTIIPGAYPAAANWMRPPHIHFKVSRRGYRELITQMYFAGEVFNEQDLILGSLPLAEQKKLIVKFLDQSNMPHPVGSFPIQITKLI